MQHTIKPFKPDKLYEVVVSACFSIKATSEEEAKQKLEALLSEIDADHWEFERISEAEH
ncbi:MAG: hypothetical protein ACTMUB_03920 [cyanobacterium endosymbiont of Rhopalodia musculus]|uniref:hypothetical protein n=1 Tax=cyanobacterium endosymbiont of Epithemia clementina EcSB TaxID=3034674 RepID=UPI0024813707|nr:hypothetical protein [cyanobacterium endosymbiont of Epithemia clementina EcSB]WGT67337.1 hypothetical protein P3F56_09065 [cyanobacterium endosymbiont of Epithemia clementina EcSB]